MKDLNRKEAQALLKGGEHEDDFSCLILRAYLYGVDGGWSHFD